MIANAPDIDSMTLNIKEETHVRAPIAATFAALLEEMGPSNEAQPGTPMPFTLEAWPGGRWFRDLGNGNGHLWGHVQSIKRPTLLEITGPLMMSFAVSSNLQYRLKEVDGGTSITLTHTALGLFPEGYREQLSQGWPHLLERIRRRVEKA
jgi:uncharacterized protein YndB with AHSA1/START domain